MEPEGSQGEEGRDSGGGGGQEEAVEVGGGVAAGGRVEAEGRHVGGGREVEGKGEERAVGGSEEGEGGGLEDVKAEVRGGDRIGDEVVGAAGVEGGQHRVELVGRDRGHSCWEVEKDEEEDGGGCGGVHERKHLDFLEEVHENIERLLPMSGDGAEDRRLQLVIDCNGLLARNWTLLENLLIILLILESFKP